MKPIEHIALALSDLDKEMETILFNLTLSLTQKDDLMLPITQQKRILMQTKEDLQYLLDNPAPLGGTCKTGELRRKEEQAGKG